MGKRIASICILFSLSWSACASQQDQQTQTTPAPVVNLSPQELMNDAKQCTTITAQEGWKRYVLNEPVNALPLTAGGWSVDDGRFPRVGAEGHVGDAAERLAPFNHYKYLPTANFGALLIAINDTKAPLVYPTIIAAQTGDILFLRINDADTSFGDNGGALTVCFR